MHLIRKCASCGRKLRFPIDRGKINVRCVCGSEFIADPDDTTLYRNADFDLSQNKKSRLNKIKQYTERIRIENIYPAVIKGILTTKYKIQNFRLLPSSEQRKMILIFIAVLIAIALIVLIISSAGNTPHEINDPMVI